MTEQKITTNRRLRFACEFFRELSAQTTDADSSDGISSETIAAIQKYEAENLKAGDLMAIRNHPGQWSIENPYQWLWLLHRYQNKVRNLILTEVKAHPSKGRTLK